MIRNKQLDIMMFIGIVMVVMGHNYVPKNIFFYQPYTFHIPLFFFISGYFFRIKTTFVEKKDWILYKIKNQLLLYFAFNILFAFIDTAIQYYFYNKVNENFIYDFFVTPFINGHQYALFIPAWFLLQLFVANIVLQLISWSKKTMVSWVLLILVIILNLYTLNMGLKGTNGLELLIIRTSQALFYMLVGHLFFRYEEKIKPHLIKFYVLIILFVTVNIINVHYGNIEFSMVWGNVDNKNVWVALLSPTLIIIMVYIVAHYIKDSISSNSIILRIGQNSFHIMIWHLTIITLVKVILMQFGMAYWGDILTVYISPNIQKYWLIYQIPALVIPVLIAEKVKTIGFPTIISFNRSRAINLFLIGALTFLFTNCTNNSLEVNKPLNLSDYIISENKMYKLILQEDGNLVLYDENIQPLWATNTTGQPITKWVFQEDGNLVLCDDNNEVYWSSNTFYSNSNIVLDNDGKLKIYVKSKPIWANGELVYNKTHLNLLDTLLSENKMYKLTLQEDGNLVIYNQNGVATWASNTENKSISYCIFQADGNLVLYDKNNNPHWSTNTANYPNSQLFLEDNGTLKIYQNNEIIWSSN